MSHHQTARSSKSMLDQALAVADLGLPIIPERVWLDGDRWRKLPLAKWDLATTDPTQIKSWWSATPEARPAVPLAQTDLVVVDVDVKGGVNGFDAFPTRDDGGVLPLGPHSKDLTPSGGVHLVFAQPYTRIEHSFKWADGVEVLGPGSLIAVYDAKEWAWPDPPTLRTKIRAPLPEVFWKPRDRRAANSGPIKKAEGSAQSHDAVEVAGLLAALRQLDPLEWRHEYAEWFALMTAYKFVGIEREDFVEWSIGDRYYAKDAGRIRRMWKDCVPQHPGALLKALKERGIRVRAGAEGPRFLIGPPLADQKQRPGVGFNSNVPKLIYELILKGTKQLTKLEQRRVKGLWANLAAKRDHRNDGLNYTAWQFKQIGVDPQIGGRLLWKACEANGYLAKDGDEVVRALIQRVMGDPKKGSK
jgi:hypothetical protein